MCVCLYGDREKCFYLIVDIRIVYRENIRMSCWGNMGKFGVMWELGVGGNFLGWGVDGFSRVGSVIWSC